MKLSTQRVIEGIRRVVRRYYPKPVTKAEFLRSRPYTSENTWKILTAHYQGILHPDLLEYGSGFSTFFHLENLKSARGGCLVSVEDNLEWFRKMWISLRHIHERELQGFDVIASPQERTFCGRIASSGHPLCFRYLYRPSTGRTGCGTFEEFREYILAPKGNYDVVVIDGRARKACIRHVLEDNLLKEGGLLALFEAGRGDARWLKKSQMEGTYDYRPEVRTLLERGAFVVDGNGYENWTGWCPNRPPHKFFSTFVPMEACFLVER